MPQDSDPIIFSCTLDLQGGRAVVRPVGEIDLATVDLVRKRLDEAIGAGARDVVLDLGEVTFLGSTGLRLALEFSAAARADGYRFVLTPGPRPVQRVFELSRVGELVVFEDS